MHFNFTSLYRHLSFCFISVEFYIYTSIMACFHHLYLKSFTFIQASWRVFTIYICRVLHLYKHHGVFSPFISVEFYIYTSIMACFHHLYLSSFTSTQASWRVFTIYICRVLHLYKHHGVFSPFIKTSIPIFLEGEYRLEKSNIQSRQGDIMSIVQ